MSRFVLDANVLLAALAGKPSAPPALLLAGVHNGDFEAVACPLLMDEVRRGLGKPYFRTRINELEGREAVAAYIDICVMLPDPAAVEPLLRDPEDDYLVALARASNARAIISGDGDLLDHPGLDPSAIDARMALKLVGVAERD